ncbi:MAG: hypothetical protein ABIF71_02560 [Planctomycetota bacterium]
MRKSLCILLLSVLAAAWWGTPAPAREPLADMGIQFMYRDAVLSGEVRDTIVAYTLDCTLTVYARGPLRLPLLSAPVALTDFKVTRGAAAGLVPVVDTEGVALIALREGEYTLHAAFVARVESRDGRMQTVIPLVPAVKSVNTLMIPGIGIKAASDKGAGLTTETQGTATRVTIYAPGEQVLPLAWWEEKVRAEAVEAMITCEESILARFGRAGLMTMTSFRFNILQGTAETLNLSLDPGLNLLEVKGEGLSYWNLQKGEKSQTLEVIFARPMTGRVDLQVTSEAPIAQVPARVAVPLVVPVGTRKVSGYLAAFVEKGLKIEVVGADEVRQIDVAALPADMTTGDTAPHLGFRFIREQFTLAVDLSEITPRVFATVFTQAKLGLQNIKARTLIGLDIKNAGVFGFTIDLPPGLKLLDINGPDINSWNVKDGRISVDLRSRAQGQYVLELSTDFPVKDPAATLFPAVQVNGVESERGYIEIEPAAGMKMQAAELTECTQIDRIELPGEFAAQASTETSTLFFRYIKHPFRLVSAVEHIQPEISAQVNTMVRIEERGLETVYDITYLIDKAGVYTLDIALDPELLLMEVNGQNIDIYKKEGDRLKVVLQKKIKGEYRLTVTCERLLKSLTPTITVPAFQLLGVKQEKGTVGIAVAVPVKLLAHPEGMRDIREVDLRTVDRELRAAGIVQAYRYFKQPWQLELKTQTIDPRLKGTVFNFVSLGRSGAAAAVAFEYSIEDAETSVFTLAFPPGAEEVTIKGVEAKIPEPLGGGRYRVTTNTGRMGTYTLFANFRLPLAADGSFNYGGVRMEGIGHQTGFVVISSSGEMEVSVDPAADGMKGIVPVEYEDVDAHFKVGITEPVLMTGRYVEPGFNLRLRTVTHDPAAVVVAVVEAARAHTTVSPNGTMMTDVYFKVRNTTEQFLRLNLPPQSEIMHLVVNDRMLAPKADGEATLVPIAGVGGRASDFHVYLRYKSPVAVLGACGTLRFDFPGTPMKIISLGWSFDLPDNFRLEPGISRNIEPVDGFRGNFGNMNASYTGAAGRGGETAGSAGTELMDQINRKAQEMNAEGAGRNRSMVTGPMPGTGRMLYFAGMFPMDRPVSVGIKFVRTGLGQALMALIILAAFAAGYAFYKYLPLANRTKTMVLFALVIIAGMVQVGSGRERPALIAAALAAAAGGLVFVFVRAIAGPRRSGTPSTPSPSDKQSGDHSSAT